MGKRQDQIPDNRLLIKKKIYMTLYFMISKSEKMLKSTKQKKKKLNSKLKNTQSKTLIILLFFLITDFIALIAVNNLLGIQLLPSIPRC